MTNSFKQKLQNQEPLLGTVITLSSTSTAEILSKVGFQWLWIDLEHAPLSLEKAQEIMQGVSTRCACLVRSPSNDEVWIKKILDTGCDGIILPQIKTAQEAKDIVKACKYPPDGSRSVGISRAQNYGMNLQEFFPTANKNIIIVLQIEHIDAVNNIEQIIDVPGFDAVLIGPFDLSGSMGIIGQVQHPKVQAAVKTVKAACIKKGMPVGIFVGNANDAIAAKKNNFSLIGVGIDSMYLWKSAKQTLDEISASDQ